MDSENINEINEYHDFETILTEYDNIDKDPFFKDNIIALRTLIEMFSEITMSYLFPISLSFTITFLLRILTRNAFDHVFLRKYGWYESVSCVVAIYIWNIISAFLSHQNLFKTQYTLSRILCLLVLLHNVITEYRYFLTPGTTTRVYMSHYFCVFMFWNYFGLGLASFFLSAHQRFVNYFILFFCSQIGLYLWTTFTQDSIRILLFGLALWEIIVEYIPCLAPTENEYQRGLYHSIYIKKFRNPNFNNYSEEKSIKFNINENAKNILLEKKIDSIPVQNAFHLTERTNELLIIENRENEFGLYPDKEYGSSALKKLEERCQQQMEDGIHIDILTLLFYVCMLIFTGMQNSMIAILAVIHLIGFSIFLNETSLVVNETQAPLRVLLYFFSEVMTWIIVDMAKPCFKNILLSSFIDVGLMELFFSFKD